MNNFLKKIVVFLSIIIAVFATSSFILASPTSATEKTRIDGSSCTNFAGLVNWDCGVKKMDSEGKVKSGVAKIATNILTDLSIIASYLVIGFVIWGGYLYIFSAGDPGKAASGKKTLTNAFIGLAIAMSATVIFSSIRIALIGDDGALNCFSEESACAEDGGEMITNLIQWVIGVAGAISLIFVVVGGCGYITAAGDPGKLQKAKATIMYALIGLAIVALSEVITAFVSDIVRKSNKAAADTSQNISIVEEIANINKEE